MASIKISELNEKTTMESNDLLPVVDNILNETKKITYENFKNEIGNSIIANKISIISGEETIAAEETKQITINYPTGFTINNCIVLNTGTTGLLDTTHYGYPDGDAMFQLNIQTKLLDDNIRFTIKSNYTSGSLNIKYKIILMKLS